jgi:hypothetical protein
MSRTLAAAVVVLLTAAPAAAGRRHRPHVPPPVLPSALAVDELEWALRPSKRVVAAGPVRIRVYNRGQDDHDLVVVDEHGVGHSVALRPGDADSMTPRLVPGRYRFFCSLQAGTPESHEARGMAFTLDVR